MAKRSQTATGTPPQKRALQAVSGSGSDPESSDLDGFMSSDSEEEYFSHPPSMSSDETQSSAGTSSEASSDEEEGHVGSADPSPVGGLRCARVECNLHTPSASGRRDRNRFKKFGFGSQLPPHIVDMSCEHLCDPCYSLLRRRHVVRQDSPVPSGSIKVTQAPTRKSRRGLQFPTAKQSPTKARHHAKAVKINIDSLTDDSASVCSTKKLLDLFNGRRCSTESCTGTLSVVGASHEYGPALQVSVTCDVCKHTSMFNMGTMGLDALTDSDGYTTKNPIPVCQDATLVISFILQGIGYDKYCKILSPLFKGWLLRNKLKCSACLCVFRPLSFINNRPCFGREIQSNGGHCPAEESRIS